VWPVPAVADTDIGVARAVVTVHLGHSIWAVIADVGGDGVIGAVSTDELLVVVGGRATRSVMAPGSVST
jgi:hypothetical protein